MAGIESDSLWPIVVDRTQEALRCGALRPIATVTERLEQDGVDFIIRVLSSLQQKSTQGNANPFLPPDPALFISDVSNTHACVLNKYNVIDHHLLFVTRYFEEQALPLTRNDLEVMLWALGEVDGLVFYNSGRGAGASQAHRHLQLVPDRSLPMSKLIRASLQSQDAQAALPFRHALLPLPKQWLDDPAGSGPVVQEKYVQLLREAGVMHDKEPHPDKPLEPYNLLATREWMLIVPRSSEHWQGISVNALGFAGSLFVRDREQLRAITSHGPMNVLRDVSMPVEEL